MSRESAFSAMDSSDMNTALNDYFGGLGRPQNPVELMKENDERNEYNEKLLELTGAVGGPLVDQGIHGATHQLLKGVKYAIGRTGKSVLGQLGITPEKFDEYAKKYGLSDQTLKDLSEGKINLTKLAKGGLDQAFEKLGKAKNIPSDLVRAGGPILAAGNKAKDDALASVHKVAGAATELQDLSSQPLKKKLSKAERRARRLAKTQRDAVGEARGKLKGNLKERFGDDRINLAGRARQANANAGKILDANVRTNAARSKLPLEITEQDAFSTGIDLPSDIKNKKDLSGKTRNDDLGSVELPEDWTPGKAPNRSVANKRQLLREQRQRAKRGEAPDVDLDRLRQNALKRGERLRGKTQPLSDDVFDDPLEKAKKRDPGFKLGTDNPFDIRVYDSPEATAARDALDAQFAKSQADAERTLAIAKNESERPALAGLPDLPDLTTVIAPKEPEQLSEAVRAQLPELPGLVGKSKIPVGPIEQGQEGFAKQQVKLLSAKLAPPAPTETNVAPTVTVASQKAPSADLEDNGVRVGGVLGGVAGAAPGVVLAAADPQATPKQRGIAAGEAAGQEAASAGLVAATGLEDAGILPGAITAAAQGGGTIAQRMERGGTAGAEQEAPRVAGALVKKATSLSTAAETDGGDVGSTAVNTATKSAEQAAAKAAAKASGEDVEESLGEDLGKKAAAALATSAETEAELGGPEDPIADIVSLGLGLGTLFGGLGGVEHQKLPTYRQPVNPSVVYGI
jgi:hypothetical protein